MNSVRKPPPNQTAHDWLSYLRESNGLGGILAKTEDLAKLRLRLSSALKSLDLEHLSSKIEAGWQSGRQDELYLLVSSASIGARLQQILPSLINELRKNGLPCKAIKIKVKPSTAAWEIQPGNKTIPSTPKGLNHVARKSWQDLLNQLEPGSDLHKAVERLLQSKSR
jgi:hypothetical protein